MDIDSGKDYNHPNPPSSQPLPELLSSHSIYIYPIHSYASQRPQPNPPLEGVISLPKTKFVKHKSMIKKPKMSDFIVNDEEEEEEVDKSYPEVILDHKYDGKQLAYLIKWDNLPESYNSWENAQTINDSVMLSTYWNEWKRKRNSLGHSSARIKRKYEEEENEQYNLIMECPNVRAYADPNILIDWNEEIDEIESIRHNDSGQLVSYVLWKSGLRSVHLLNELHEKAPKKMCKWYSNHLRFMDNKDLRKWH
ncbi:12417_t:CDS:2 [Funneliformis caledonium]|uniref:12417_t:CDS:1 n=1 Tax=Funneliformis caledonium TaxID=1117310 RepID=A0A9N8WL05_9GLOM|nr:12417_t:CDS:2 [Funneliformis caledonium]